TAWWARRPDHRRTGAAPTLRAFAFFAATAVLSTVPAKPAAPPAAGAGSIDRAVAYLTEEVPRWSRENGCVSCHNNGDGARALLAAGRSGRPVPEEALTETRRWLRQPEAWRTVRTDPA